MGVPEVILETPAYVSRVLVVKAYPRAAGLSALLILWQPYICPLCEIIKSVPLYLSEKADSRTGRWRWKFHRGMRIACGL